MWQGRGEWGTRLLGIMYGILLKTNTTSCLFVTYFTTRIARAATIQLSVVCAPSMFRLRVDSDLDPGGDIEVLRQRPGGQRRVGSDVQSALSLFMFV